MPCKRHPSAPAKSAPCRWAFRGLLAVCAGLWLTGCAGTSAPEGSRFSVRSKSAQFYKNGPAQAPGFDSGPALNYPTANLGPDFQLSKGATVTLVKREFGFSQVMTDDGQVGYMANDQLQPAPALTRAAPAAEPRKSSPRTRSKRPSPPARSNEQPLDLSDLDLPLPS